LRFDDVGGHIYIFNHIPKGSGTAARYVLGEWLPIVADYRRGLGDDETQDFIERKIDLGRLRRPACVCGHYGLDGAYLHQRYPHVFENPRYRLITFVREPLETAISTYYYVKKLGLDAFSEDIDHYLKHYRTNYAGVLNCINGSSRNALAAYWFVGLAERLSESVSLLGYRMNKPFVEPPHLNVTIRTASPSEAACRIFRQNNARDYEIYTEAQRNFERAIKREPPTTRGIYGN
jgi:hypothetical protein